MRSVWCGFECHWWTVISLLPQKYIFFFYPGMTGISEQKASVCLSRVFFFRQILSETSRPARHHVRVFVKCGGWWMSVSISAGTVKWQLSVTVTSYLPEETRRLQVAPFSKSLQECEALNSPSWRLKGSRCLLYSRFEKARGRGGRRREEGGGEMAHLRVCFNICLSEIRGCHILTPHISQHLSQAM